MMNKKRIYENRELDGICRVMHLVFLVECLCHIRDMEPEKTLPIWLETQGDNTVGEGMVE